MCSFRLIFIFNPIFFIAWSFSKNYWIPKVHRQKDDVWSQSHLKSLPPSHLKGRVRLQSRFEAKPYEILQTPSEYQLVLGQFRQIGPSSQCCGDGKCNYRDYGNASEPVSPPLFSIYMKPLVRSSTSTALNTTNMLMIQLCLYSQMILSKVFPTNWTQS